MISKFFINTQDGRVATHKQMVEGGLVAMDEKPALPWHPIQGTGDESTLWYVMLRKQERGVFIGTMCVRHTGRQALLEKDGWTEVPVEEIGL